MTAKAGDRGGCDGLSLSGPGRTHFFSALLIFASTFMVFFQHPQRRSAPARFLAAAAVCAGTLLGLWSGSGNAHAQAQGEFVIPAIRADGGTRFAYWDYFANNLNPEPGQGRNFNYPNAPALIGGLDDASNPTNLMPLPPQSATAWVRLVQNGTNTAFITSSGAIYSWQASTSFSVEYDPPHEDDVTNVIFQIQSGGTGFNIDDIVLKYNIVENGETVAKEAIADYHAMDDPQTGEFAERIISAMQWNLTGLGVRDFRLEFRAQNPSMPLYQAQLDVVEGRPFEQALGRLLFFKFLPLNHAWPWARPGALSAVVAEGEEDRFYLPGREARVVPRPASQFAHVGWVADDGTITESEFLDVTFADENLTVTGLFTPLTYAAFRDKWFYHSNYLHGTNIENNPYDHTTTGQSTNDHADDRFSAPEVDPDQDGLNNFGEFAFGGDPYLDDTARTQPVAAWEDGALTLTYLQPASEAVAIEYRLQGSTDLQTWTDVPASVLRRVVELSGHWRVTLREDVAAGATPHPFLRLHAEAKP